MAVDNLKLAPKQKRPAAEPCCVPVVFPDVEREAGGAHGPHRDGARRPDPGPLELRQAGHAVFGARLYEDEADGASKAAVEASLGCGVPTAVADLYEGETVLDLGSGAGADILISAKRVGPSGRAIGLDMTDEMLDLARANAAHAGTENVEILKGYIEDIPLPDDSVDVAISNCVINLAADKRKVLAEAVWHGLVPAGGRPRHRGHRPARGRTRRRLAGRPRLRPGLDPGLDRGELDRCGPRPDRRQGDRLRGEPRVRLPRGPSSRPSSSGSASRRSRWSGSTSRRPSRSPSARRRERRRRPGSS
jgi:SAM-dependent methyltransferase